MTGLVWEVKTADGGLHDKNDTYTWYNTDSATNGGDPGDEGNSDTCYGYNSNDPATYCNTQAYVARVNQAGLCGYHDWRMPTQKELRSLVDYSVPYPGPTIDTGSFPNQEVPSVWSSLPNTNGSSAKLLNFSMGFDDSHPKNLSHAVRLLRGGQ